MHRTWRFSVVYDHPNPVISVREYLLMFEIQPTYHGEDARQLPEMSI